MGLLSWLGRNVDDLVREGYPLEVAKRISSGELPMDEASRAARRDAFGLDAYHLTNKDFDEFKLGGYDPDMSGEAVWLSPVKQEKYPAAHNVFLPLDDPSRYAEILEKQAATKMGGGRSGAIDSRVMPLKVKMDDPLSVDEFNLAEMQDRWAGGSREFPYLISPETSKRLREAGFDSVSNEIGMWDEGYDVGSAEIVSLKPENIRSQFAAFDPEYTGPNILGSRIAPTVATGLLGGAGLYTALKSNKATANPIDELRAAERDFGLSDIEKLRASEREFAEPNYNQAKLYDEANTLWQNTGQTLKNIGAPDLAVDIFTPTFESSRDKAMGDKSTMTNIFAALEKLDPTAYAGLLGALARRGMN